MASHRWTRSAGLVLGIAVLAAAPAAHATDITNPADHPAPITLTIDGQTYRDGADTLPGYDDYACTPIPNVQYDFGSDEIQYYDGGGELIQTAHWTEWSRISSYDTWVAQQGGGKTPTTTQTTTNGAGTTPTTTTTTTTQSTTSTATATPTATNNAATTNPTTKTTSATSQTRSSATKTTSSATKNNNNSSAGTKHASTKTGSSTGSSSGATSHTTKSGGKSSHATTTGASTTASAKHGTTKHQAAGAAATTDPAATTATAPAGTAPAANGTAAPAPTAGAAANTPKYKLVSDKGAAGSVGDTRPVGIGILVAVFAAAGLAYVFGFGRRGVRASSSS